MAEQNAPSTRTLSRTRGAASGLLLVLLGAWGALAPFIGPSISFAFTPDKSWHWTAARGWYEVLPGAAAFLGGLLLLFARNRAVTVFGAWLGILAGGWFIIGAALSTELTLGSLGQPIGSSSGQRSAEVLAFFYGLGAVILYLAAAAFGRLSVVTVRDLRVAERREAAERERIEQERFDPSRESVRPQDYRLDDDDDPATARGAATPYGAPDDTRVYGHPGEDTRTSGYPPAPAYGSGEQTSQYGTPAQDAGEQSSQYGAPTYGRHDVNVRGTTSNTSETQGPAASGEPPQEPPR